MVRQNKKTPAVLLRHPLIGGLGRYSYGCKLIELSWRSPIRPFEAVEKVDSVALAPKRRKEITRSGLGYR